MKNRLKALRGERGLTLRGLARAAGLNLTLVWELECDLRDPTPEQREKICVALQATNRQLWTAPRVPVEGRSTAA